MGHRSLAVHTNTTHPPGAHLTNPTREFDTPALLTAGLLGAAAAALNVLLFFGAEAAGVNMVGQCDPSTPASPLSVAMVAIESLVPAVVGTGILAGMNAFMARPGRVFAGIAVVVGLLSMGGPATLAGADGGTKVVLALMHVLAAGANSGALLTRGKRG